MEGFEGHHINSVRDHDLAMARNPDNVGFKEGRAEHLAAHGGNWSKTTSGPLLNRALGAAVAFITAYDAKMQELADQSPLVSDPNSMNSWINPSNYVVEPIGLVHGAAAALKESSDNDP